MRSLPLLLMRLLLCLALVANGVASAQAGVRMALAAAPVAATAPVDATDVPPCHRHMPPPAVHDDAPMPGHGDCCKDGPCDCPGAPTLLQGIVVLRLPPGPVLARAVPRDPTDAYPAPDLRHLIRPPIG